MGEGITPEQIVYGISFASDPQLSPNGERVVYSISNISEEKKKRPRTSGSAIATAAMSVS